jgi:hypothetical protein
VTGERLPTALWVMAHLRRANAESVTTTVLRKGEPNSGTLLVKINRLDDRCRLLSQARDIEGNLGWLAAFKGAEVPEAEADAYIARAVDRDPDLWVIEVEDREGRQPFEGRML